MGIASQIKRFYQLIFLTFSLKLRKFFIQKIISSRWAYIRKGKRNSKSLKAFEV